MAKTNEKTETYVLVRGKHAGLDAETGERRVFAVGDKVELTKAQAESFTGKFKSLKQVRAEAKMHEDDEELDSQEQPIAPLDPTNKDGVIADDKARAATEKMAAPTPVTPVKPATK